MSLLRDLQKTLKAHHLLALLGLLVLVVAVSQFSERKGLHSEGMAHSASTGRAESGSHATPGPTPTPEDQAVRAAAAGTGTPAAAAPAGQNEVYGSAKGVGSPTVGLPPSCVQANATKPGDLLPKDANSQWGHLNPSGGGGLEHVNLLKAGYHTGIDTVGTVLRNANLQVRSEPPNPTTKVSPWMNTTIEPDLMRVPLEIGCGPQ